MYTIPIPPAPRSSTTWYRDIVFPIIGLPAQCYIIRRAPDFTGELAPKPALIAPQLGADSVVVHQMDTLFESAHRLAISSAAS
jgi:hypothetical protein